jgi:hypothetical protein
VRYYGYLGRYLFSELPEGRNGPVVERRIVWLRPTTTSTPAL